MIEVRDVGFAYAAGMVALDGVSLAVGAGERVALLGLNGSGKSTLGRVLNGSLAPSGGCVAVDGAVLGAHELVRRVGYVRQDPRNQIVSSVVRDEVAFGPRNLGLPREEVLARVEEALAACGISGLAGRLTSELSGGQQQLVALAGVLAMRPEYLVLDEAASMLDCASRERLSGVVDRLVAGGVGVLEIAHGLETARAADRVAVMAEGRVAWQGSPDELLACPEALAAAGLSEPRVEGGCGAPDGHRLSLERVSVARGGVGVLRDLTLEARGLTLLLGASGAGKTTCAQVLSGVLAPDAGRALLDGAPVRAGQVGLAFQRPEDQLFADTVLDDIAFGPLSQGVPEDEALARARAAAARLGLDEGLLERSPTELSGGQMRRAALAGIVACGPSAYVFDEPTAGLDGPGCTELVSLVRDLVADGAAAVVITHDPELWRGLSPREVVLEAVAPAGSCRARAGSLGLYVPGDTLLHRADARAKLALLLLATVAAFAGAAPWGLAVTAAWLAAALAASRTSAVAVARALRPAAVVLAFSLLANAVVLVGEPGISVAGAARGVAAVARIVLVVGFALVFSATTQPADIAEGLASLMAPLERAGVPVGDLSATVSIALRFVPLAAEELERIRMAQRARGARLDEGSPIERLRRWLSVLPPLLVALFRRADELARAMTDRCYTGKMTSLTGSLAPRDWALLAAGVIVLLAACVPALLL